MSHARYFFSSPREEVIKAVERRNPIRVPLVRAHWWGEGLQEQYGERLKALECYPEDAAFAWITHSNYAEWGLPWKIEAGGAYDSHCVMDDWSKLDDLIAHLPNAETDPRFEGLSAIAEQAHRENRYLLFAFWRLFFERPWEIRGMQNLLMDYYIHPQQVHRLYNALCEMYTAYLQRAIPRNPARWILDERRPRAPAPAVHESTNLPRIPQALL